MLTKKTQNRGASVVCTDKGCDYHMQCTSICPARASQDRAKFSVCLKF